MLQRMIGSTRCWGVVLAAILGLWAGVARAQGEDGGWFEGAEPERPLLRIHGSGPYDPPPPDFRSDAPAPPAPAQGPEVIEEGEAQRDGAEWEDGGVREDDPEARERALAEFSPHLTRYGHWVDDPFYGRIWVPHRRVVGSDFKPYVSGGHWELTVDDEWVWVSDYPFGWITFHYGRWVWVTSGWAWVPGYVWAPAWVDFRIGPSGYIGWGPAPPYHVWRSGVFISLGFARPVPYIFCPTTYVFSRSLHRHVIHDRYRVRSIARDTYRYRPHRVAGFSRVLRGPSPAEANIPPRALPPQRTIARPRLGEFAAAGGRTAEVTRGAARPMDRRALAPGSSPGSRVSPGNLSSPGDLSRSSTSRSANVSRGAARTFERPPASMPRARSNGISSRQIAPGPSGSWQRSDAPRAAPRDRGGAARRVWGDDRVAVPGGKPVAGATGSSASKRRWGDMSPGRKIETGRDRGALAPNIGAPRPSGAPAHKADRPNPRSAPRGAGSGTQHRAKPSGRTRR